jgi:hypothetical protein
MAPQAIHVAPRGKYVTGVTKVVTISRRREYIRELLSN